MPALLASPPRARIELSEADQASLLDVARRALIATVGAQPLAATHEAPLPPGLVRRCGAAFVTLTKDHELRGCVGILDGSRPLSETVAGAAMSAALRDGRFPPVLAGELSRIRIEVSVLGPMVPLDDPMAFEPGIDGLVVRRGFAQGLLLPEVASTNGLDAMGMLTATCWKAGLPADAWRDPRTEVLAFRTTRFGGPALT